MQRGGFIQPCARVAFGGEADLLALGVRSGGSGGSDQRPPSSRQTVINVGVTPSPSWPKTRSQSFDEQSIAPDFRPGRSYSQSRPKKTVGTNRKMSLADQDWPAERDLAEDAQWKRIQQNTFTRWTNEHLKTVGLSIGNLETELADGLLLIRLVEVLSHKKLPKHTKRPSFRSQKLENVSVALKFLEQEEGIRIINIDSSDIVDQRLKLIMGLIWMLILHYSISMPVWDDEDREVVKETPKQRLMGWIRQKLPSDVPVTNFTSDWNDGIALGALVDAVAPGLNPDWRDWKPKDAEKNTSEAMELAREYLDVPQLLEPHELIDPNVDELSVMTYLSQYPNARLKNDAPLRKRGEPKPSKVTGKAYGPGLKGAVVGASTDFTVEPSDRKKADLVVSVLRPTGGKEAADVYFDEQSGTFGVRYTPQVDGVYKIAVVLAGKPMDGSPFAVPVSVPPVDVSKVHAAGPGLENGVVVAKPTSFDIFTVGAGKSKPDVVIVDKDGKQDTVKPVVKMIDEDVYRVEYVPVTSGLHSVNVFYDRKHITNSPFGVRVVPASYPARVRAWGRGLASRGVRVGDIADFKVSTEGAGDGKVAVFVSGPHGENVPVKQTTDATGAQRFSYAPTKPGDYVVQVKFDGEDVAKSPYQVAVGKPTDLRIRAFGPGLEGGMSNLPANFTVETNGEIGALGFSIEGPSKAKIHCTDNKDGSAEIEYLPTAAGEYEVHVLCGDEDIKDSPFMVEMDEFRDGLRPSLVKCHGQGLQRRGAVKCDKPAEFTVEARGAGPPEIKPKIWVLDKELQPVNVQVLDNGDQTYTCSYLPHAPVKHNVIVSYGGIAVPGSPFRVQVEEAVDPSKVRVHGPGVEPGVRSLQPTHFVIDAKNAGPGEVEVALSDALTGGAVDLDVLDNHDGSFTIKYTAPRPGSYQLRVVFAGHDLLPIQINVQPHLDVGGIRVEGLDNTVFVGCRQEFVVNAQTASRTPSVPAGDRVKALLAPPQTKNVIPLDVVDRHDGTYSVSFVPHHEGAHHIAVYYENLEVTPKTTYAVHGADAGRVKAFGPGLNYGVVDRQCEFQVDTKNAGQGGLGIQITGPSEAVTQIQDNTDGSCTVQYNPTEPGVYEIGVKFADVDIPGSPFRAIVDYEVDARKVVASGPGLDSNQVREGVPVSFEVDATRSGLAPLDVTLKADRGPQLAPPQIYELNNKVYRVTYMPLTADANVDINITYDERQISASPIRVRVQPVFEPEKVKLTSEDGGTLSDVPASLPVRLLVDATKAGDADLQVVVTGPEGEPRLVKVVDSGNNTYEVNFIPDDPGRYEVLVRYGGQPIARQPHSFKAYPVGDASKCWIVEKPSEPVAAGEEHCVTVNTANAGKGRLTARMQPVRGGTQPLDVEVGDNGDGTFTVYFTPILAEPHAIRLMYGGRDIPDGAWTMQVDLAERIKAERLTSGAANGDVSKSHPVAFWNFNFEDIDIRKLKATVMMPNKKMDAPSIVENHDGTVTVKYQPKVQGTHILEIKHDQSHVQGSPFTFHVDAVSDGYVSAFGSGLSYGIAGEPASFTVCAKEAGAGHSIVGHGGLSVAIEGPAKAEIKCHDNKDGTCAVSWIPPAPGEYFVHIKFADKEIHNSPFSAKVAGEGRKRAHMSVGSTSEVSLKISETDVKGLSASIKSPSGIEEPCFIRKIDNGHLGISFTPREVGEHLVSVKKKGTMLPNSPFRIKVNQSEVGDASKVKISGPGTSQALTQQFNEVVIDTRNAGYGGLSLSLEGPSKAEIQCQEAKDGTIKVHYKPTEPGIYVLGVKFADHHVNGSPFTVKCGGQGVGTVLEKISKPAAQASVVNAGQDCRLNLKLPNTSALEVNAKIMNPEGVSEDIEMRDLGENFYEINFKPQMEGQHAISVLHKEQHVSGSPFQFTVGKFSEGGAHKVRAGGSGLLRGEVNLQQSFNVYTREAGAGNLSIAVEGPAKAQLDFKDHKDGNCHVLYTVNKIGEYQIAVKFDDKHIPDSPFKVFIAPASGEVRKLELASFPSMGLPVDKPVSFNVLTHRAKGHLEAKVTTPNGAVEPVDMVPIDEGEAYAFRFVPRDPGNYYVHVTLDAAPMRDSPFRVRVGGREESDPTAVTASGDGLKRGETGQKCEYIINTCNAGAGNLHVTVDGPSKVTLDAYEVDLGYKVRYTPLAPGDYFMTIKYNGIHIPGSPFKVRISGKELGGSGYNESSTVKVDAVAKTALGTIVYAPKYKGDASKVECKGMGLKKAFPGRPTIFNIDCAQAGQDLLFVGVIGTKGPCEEVIVKHQGRGVYVVNYKISERGRAFVFVKYGDQHVPGSPFAVDV